MSCVAEVIFTTIAILLINQTGIEFNKVKSYVDALIVKNAWLDSKQNLISMLNLGCRADFVSYENWWRRRFELRNYVQALRGKNPFSYPETPEFRIERADLEHAQK